MGRKGEGGEVDPELFEGVIFKEGEDEGPGLRVELVEAFFAGWPGPFLKGLSVFCECAFFGSSLFSVECLRSIPRSSDERFEVVAPHPALSRTGQGMLARRRPSDSGRWKGK
jgi:hypothetical protein